MQQVVVPTHDEILPSFPLHEGNMLMNEGKSHTEPEPVAPLTSEATTERPYGTHSLMSKPDGDPA